MDVFLTGFGVSLSFILAIGAQNAFVLKQGLKRQHVGITVGICTVTDALLIGAGVAGFSWVTAEAPWLTAALLYGGVVFLILFGVSSFYSAWVGMSALEAAGGTEQSWQSVFLTCIAVTWLNPHMYLDTIVLIGSVSSQYPEEELTFWGGAVAASAIFFLSLGYGARLLAPVFARRHAWRILDILVGCLMWAIAFSLLFNR